MNEAISFTACYLYLTENCNLRCKYCFENETRGTSSMSFDTAKKSIDFLISNALKQNSKHIDVTFFGGEPLLSLDLMIDIFHYAVNEGSKHDIKFKFQIITNGTIVNTKYEEFLLELYSTTKHIDIQVSIDGVPQIQDKNRVFVNDKPSSQIVEKNIVRLLKLFKDNGINTSYIRTHSVLTKNNISMLFQNFRYFKEIGINNPEFVFVNEDDWNENDISVYTGQLSLIADYIYKECLSTCSLDPYYSAGGIIIQRTDSISKDTCAAGKAFCSIAPNGDIYPCHRIFTNNRSKKLGNVFDGIIDNDIRKVFLNSSRKDMHAGSNSCSDCENTECVICMAYNIEKYGDMHKCNPAVCSIYKAKYNFIIETKKRFNELSNFLNYNSCNEIGLFNAVN